ncbi:VOC family protein [Clostridium manihotivorum]|uniref:VOC family protein n=2 Tax=Clostridium manihotivorum TaxID=2320868 RepID=A0A410DTQ0_9CLOT|nr:VOC family protein [Clostridium manihotivorum]
MRGSNKMEFMIQLYVKNAKEAIELYKKAFDAKLVYIEYTQENAVLHSEIIAHGQKLAISDYEEASVTGTVFQIDVRMQTAGDVEKAYEVLREESNTNVPIGSSSFSPCMVDFVDKFGVRWCLFSEWPDLK